MPEEFAESLIISSDFAYEGHNVGEEGGVYHMADVLAPKTTEMLDDIGE